MNECDSNPCYHGCECDDLIDGFLCTATPASIGWTGQRCDVVESKCTPGVCQNGALCLDLFDTYICMWVSSALVWIPIIA